MNYAVYVYKLINTKGVVTTLVVVVQFVFILHVNAYVVRITTYNYILYKNVTVFVNVIT